MTNGNTGVADLLCGNWHMRQDWDYMMDSTSFTIRSPEDGLEQPIVIPLEWPLCISNFLKAGCPAPM